MNDGKSLDNKIKTSIVNALRRFLGIEDDKAFLLEYGDATASRVDGLEVRECR